MARGELTRPHRAAAHSQQSGWGENPTPSPPHPMQTLPQCLPPAHYLLVQPEAQRHSLAALLVGAFSAIEVLAEFRKRHAGFPIWVEHVGWGQHYEGVRNRTWEGGNGGQRGGDGSLLYPLSMLLGQNKHSWRGGWQLQEPGPVHPPAWGGQHSTQPQGHTVPPPMQRSTRPLQHQPSVSPCSSRCCLLVMIYHMHSFGRANERFNYYIYPHRLLLSVSSPLRPPLRAHTRWQIPTAPQIPALAAGPPAPVALSPPTPQPPARV